MNDFEFDRIFTFLASTNLSEKDFSKLWKMCKEWTTDSTEGKP